MVEIETNQSGDNAEILFSEWVSRIAQEVPLDHLVEHFREHVGEHFERFDRTDPTNMAVWLVDVLNFMHIFEKMNLGITKEDMLFKLCLHYRNQEAGPEPEFDSDKLIINYQGRFKKFDALSLSDKQNNQNANDE